MHAHKTIHLEQFKEKDAPKDMNMVAYDGERKREGG